MVALVPHNSPRYLETLALRELVLRRPLGMRFTPEEIAAEAGSFHFGLWADAGLMACLLLQPIDAHTVRMRQFAVHPDHQRKGIGSRLARHAEAFALESGFQTITLHARETAVEFYRNRGYHPEGERFIEATLPHFKMLKHLVAKECA